MGEFNQGFYACYNILQANGGDKDGGQMILLVGKRMCPPGLEQREVENFRPGDKIWQTRTLTFSSLLMVHVASQE